MRNARHELATYNTKFAPEGFLRLCVGSSRKGWISRQHHGEVQRPTSLPTQERKHALKGWFQGTIQTKNNKCVLKLPRGMNLSSSCRAGRTSTQAAEGNEPVLKRSSRKNLYSGGGWGTNPEPQGGYIPWTGGQQAYPQAVEAGVRAFAARSCLLRQLPQTASSKKFLQPRFRASRGSGGREALHTLQTSGFPVFLSQAR